MFHGFDEPEPALNDSRLAEAFQAAFGQSVGYLCLTRNSETHVPSELARNPTQDETEQQAVLLREAGVRVEVIPAPSSYPDIKHWFYDFQNIHQASNGERFTDWEGIVVRGALLDLSRILREWLKVAGRTTPFRKFELGHNHEHPTHTLTRHGLRMARRRGAELGAALRECFPERAFLLVYRAEQVSFCRFTESLPIGIFSANRSVVCRDEVCYCPVCERATPYQVRAQPDTEFPNAGFADCAVCENEVILWVDEEVVLSSDAAFYKSLPMPETLSDSGAGNSSQARFPASFAELKATVSDRLYPSLAGQQARIRQYLNRDPDTLSPDDALLAQTLLQIEEFSALLLKYRVRQLSLSPEAQDRSTLTPERLGIPRSHLLYHPVRRVLAPVTAFTSIDDPMVDYAILNATNEYYQAGRRLDPEQAIYECRFEYGLLETRGRMQWEVDSEGKRYYDGNDTAPHGANAWTCEHYGVVYSLKNIAKKGMDRHLAISVIYDEQKRVIAQHRRLFRPFHELDIEPNPVIELELSNGFLTLRSEVFVWGVFLSWHSPEKLPDNAFDLLPGIAYSIPWDESVSGAPKIWRTGNRLFGESGA